MADNIDIEFKAACRIPKPPVITGRISGFAENGPLA
jgi:hypothetical protein